MPCQTDIRGTFRSSTGPCLASGVAVLVLQIGQVSLRHPAATMSEVQSGIPQQQTQISLKFPVQDVKID